MDKRRLLVVGLSLASLGRTAFARESHSGGSHSSRGGHYAGGHGSSHKGGHYVNPRTANHYGFRTKCGKPANGKG